MCGIIGFINCGSKYELENAVSSIKHRGPDHQDTKWFTNHNTGIGHSRLSIIDLSSAGSQPMYDKNTGNWIVFNGEVYNYQQIRDTLKQKGYSFKSASDTEVVLKAFGEWGRDAVNRFNGMFSFVIYNENSNNVFACRDRLGIKPLYYYQNKDKLIFASEIKSILECSNYKKEPDYYAIQTPVHFQINPRTGFKDIFKLEAGHYFTFKDNKLNIGKYWDIYPTEQNITYKNAFEELDYLINDSIDLQMISDVPIGSLLSGGLDSSIISVLMQRKMTQPLNTYTIKFKKNDLKRQGNVDDSFYAKRLANEFGFNHKEIILEPQIIDLLPKIVWHLDEPIADPAAINTYLISKEAEKDGIKVLLSGMGADEVFSGYRSHLACVKVDSYQKIPQILRKGIESILKILPESNSKRNFKYVRWAKGFSKIAKLSKHDRSLVIKNSALNSDDFRAFFLDAIDYRESLYVKRDTEIFNQYSDISYLTKLCYSDTKNYLTNHNLAYYDKAIMAASVEGRPPLIDHRIVELMFKLPARFRINNGIQKYLLKKVSEKYLPKEIIYRPKAPFSVPMRGWLNKELKEMVHDILSYDSLKKRNIYNPEYVQKLIKNNDNGIEDNSQLIWRLMVSEIWFRTFFN